MVITSKEVKAPEIKHIFVEYLESTGTEHIDTGVLAKSTLKVVADVMPLQVVAYSIIGYYNAEADCFRLFNANNCTYLDFGASGASRLQGASGTFPANTRKHIEFANRYVKDLETDTVIVEGTPTAAFEKSTTLFINGNRNFAKARWYSCQIYDEDVLIRDFWPCYDPNGVPCLYEAVEQKYYYNAGTGDFVAGVAV